MSKIKVILILLVTDSLLKQYLLPQLSYCTFFITPKPAKVTLELKQAGAINPNSAESDPYTNLTPGICGHLTTDKSLKNLKRIHR